MSDAFLSLLCTHCAPTLSGVNLPASLRCISKTSRAGKRSFLRAAACFPATACVCAFCVAAVGILLSWSTALHCCGKACASRNGALFCRREAIPFQWGRDVCWMSFRGGCAVQKQAVSPTRSACSWVILWKMSPGSSQQAARSIAVPAAGRYTAT